jgi:D-sedoheptulose 7-phosphate isomerase
MTTTFNQIVLEHQALVEAVRESLSPVVVKATQLVRETLENGHKILVCGNGGSAADAQHFAAELIGRFDKTKPALPAISLATDSSIISALGNDIGFDQIFSRQIEALGQPGDLLIAISTSGGSRNILRAAKTARERGLGVLALTGREPKGILAQADLLIDVPSFNTQRIQEIHEICLHSICEVLESLGN